MRHRLLLIQGLLILCASLVACGGSMAATVTVTSPTRAAGVASAIATSAPTAAAASSVAIRTAPAATTAPIIPSATSAPTVSAATAPAASAAGGGNVVMVQLKDFAIMLDTSTMSAGMVTFIIKNNGPSPHNFNVKINGEEKGVPTLDPGTTATLTLDLKPGAYDYRCNIPGHDLLGMKGTVTAK
jgi:uncharacterized cupredoxin-like copper-binding protein